MKKNIKNGDNQPHVPSTAESLQVMVGLLLESQKTMQGLLQYLHSKYIMESLMEDDLDGPETGFCDQCKWSRSRSLPIAKEGMAMYCTFNPPSLPADPKLMHDEREEYLSQFPRVLEDFTCSRFNQKYSEED